MKEKKERKMEEMKKTNNDASDRFVMDFKKVLKFCGGVDFFSHLTLSDPEYPGCNRVIQVSMVHSSVYTAFVWGI